MAITTTKRPPWQLVAEAYDELMLGTIDLARLDALEKLAQPPTELDPEKLALIVLSVAVRRLDGTDYSRGLPSLLELKPSELEEGARRFLEEEAAANGVFSGPPVAADDSPFEAIRSRYVEWRKRISRISDRYLSKGVRDAAIRLQVAEHAASALSAKASRAAVDAGARLLSEPPASPIRDYKVEASVRQEAEIRRAADGVEQLADLIPQLVAVSSATKDLTAEMTRDAEQRHQDAQSKLREEAAERQRRHDEIVERQDAVAKENGRRSTYALAVALLILLSNLVFNVLNYLADR
ncbi:MAG: hypothetical protein ACQEXJ_10195 [Myxococcota bacterium]